MISSKEYGTYSQMDETHLTPWNYCCAQSIMGCWELSFFTVTEHY